MKSTRCNDDRPRRAGATGPNYHYPMPRRARSEQQPEREKNESGPAREGSPPPIREGAGAYSRRRETIDEVISQLMARHGETFKKLAE
jgi:hypothetical protein